MIREEFFPTSIYGKDIQLDNNKLAENIMEMVFGVSKLTNISDWKFKYYK